MLCLGESRRILKEIINNDKDFNVFEDFLSICLYPDIGEYFCMFNQVSQELVRNRLVISFMNF